MPQTALSSLLRHLVQATPPRGCELSDGCLLRRFAEHRDEAAFAMLLRRHGPMVLGVCRRVLGGWADAEDAFQATFLVLVRRAGSIRKRDSVGSWLHGVAARLAQRAQVDRLRRKHHEEKACLPDGSADSSHLWFRELRSVLDQELALLPERLRDPLVLCYLEGKTYEEAARQLGWSDGTIRARLARGRACLRSRLTRQGFGVPAITAGLAFGGRDLLAAVPARLASTTLRVGLLIASDSAAAAGVSKAVAALADSAMKTIAFSKLKMTAVFLVLMSGLLAGAGALAQVRTEEQPPASTDQIQKKPPADPAKTQTAKDDPSARLDANGDALPAEAIARLGTTRFRSAGRVMHVRFTPDGKKLITRGSDMRVWDVATGKSLVSIPLTDSSFTPDGPDLSTDGKLLVLPGKAGIQFWEVATGKKVRTIDAGDKTHLVRFSPDNRTLATLGGAALDEIALWDVDSGKNIRIWTGNKDANFLAFDPDGKTLITGGMAAIRNPAPHCLFNVWDVASGKKVRDFDVGALHLRKTVLSPDGKLLALHFWWLDEADANRIEIWDVQTGLRLTEIKVKPKTELPKNYPGVSFCSIQFSSDSKTLYGIGVDNCLIAFDALTGKEVSRHGSGIKNPEGFDLSPDGKTLAVGQHTHIRLFDMPKGTERIQGDGHGLPINHVLVTPDGRKIITACINRILVWDAATGKRLLKLGADRDFIRDIRLTDEGRSLIVSSTDNAGMLLSSSSGDRFDKLDLATGKQDTTQVASDLADSETPAFVGTFPRKRILDDAIQLLDKKTEKELCRIPKPSSRICNSAFTPDGRRLIAWCADHSIYSWDVATGKELVKFTFADQPAPGMVAAAGGAADEGPPYQACLSPDGHSIVFGSYNKFLTFHDLNTGKQIRKVENLAGDPFYLRYSLDGKTLAWGSYNNDGDIHLLEVATGRERRKFTAPQAGGIRHISFLPDGKRLVSSSEDTTAMVWDLAGALETRKKLAPADLDDHWSALAGADAVKAFQSVRCLTSSPTESVPYLKAHLALAAPPDEKRIAKMLMNLDSNDFETREAAAVDLEKLGELAIPTIQKALADPSSPEVRRRLEALVDKQEEERGNPSPERVRLLRTVEILESIASPEAKQLLSTLAKGASGSVLTRESQAAVARLNQGIRKSP